tara:strand:+ start:532 stop:1017 length:486 start_codon:yes stop_codon:yes gene_type:complete
MNVKFDFLPDNSRIWIYPSNRKFSNIELEMLKTDLSIFLANWTAHNKTLEAGFDIPYNRFIVIGINQQKMQASGCSIDASVRFIQKLETKYNIVLLDKMNVTFKQGAFLSHKPLDEFIKMAKAKSVSKETIVFNNLVDTISDYKRFWEVPAGESWHSRYIK